MSHPKHTSVVIPCYNGAAYISNAIEGCFSEGVEGRRLIVIDDGSTDNTQAVLDRFGTRIHVHRIDNGGAAHARNIGLGLAETEFVIFLDADDTYGGGILNALESAMLSDCADLGLGHMQNVGRDGSLGALKAPPPVESCDLFLTEWLNGRTVGTNSQMWRTRFLQDIGGFREGMLRLEEIEHVARAVLLGARITTSDVGYSLYVDHGNIDRVSYGNSEAVIASTVDGFAALEALMHDRPAVRRALGKRFYMEARSAFRIGNTAIGRDALRRARSCGFYGHIGTISHRALCNLIGLEHKETHFARHSR